MTTNHLRPAHRNLHRLMLASALVSVSAWASAAMQSLTEGEMSSVNGQAGVEINLESAGVSLGGFRLSSDNTNTVTALGDPCTGGNCGGIWASGLYMTPVGAAQGTGYIKLDTGADSNTAIPWFSYQLHLDTLRTGGAGTNTGYAIGGVGSTTRDIGQVALIMPLDFSFAGQPFYGLPNGNVDVNLQINNGALFYRQLGPGHSQIAGRNVYFQWSSPTDIADYTVEGFRMSGPASYFRVAFNGYYKFHADQDMATFTANDRPGMSFSWGGQLYDTLLFNRGGGLWNTTITQATNVAFNAAGTATTNLPTVAQGLTQGLNLGLRWNYRNPLTPAVPGNFLWSIGHPEGDQENVQFGDWQNLQQATGAVPNRYGFDIPMMVIDAVAAPTATNAAGSLCWGNTMTGAACSPDVDGNSNGVFTDVHYDNKGTLLTLRAGTIEGYPAPLSSINTPTAVTAIRNGNLLAWSNQVTMLTGGPSGTLDYPAQSWGLTYTLPNINSNVYTYAGGNEDDTAGGSRNHGLILDLLTMTQSYGQWQSNYTIAAGGTCDPVSGAGCVNTTRWSQGGHIMIADTAAQMGIGFLGGSALIAIDDMRLWIKDTTLGQVYPNNLTGGIDLFSPRTRINIRTMFGGAVLPRGLNIVRGAYIDLNAEGLVSFRMSPPSTDLEAGKSAESRDVILFSMGGRFRCGSDVGVIYNFGCANNTFADAAGSTVKSGLGSYIALEEPGYPGVDLRYGDFSGDFAISEGGLQIRASADTDADIARNAPARSRDPVSNALLAKPDLAISQKILIGASAASRLTDGAVGVGLGVGGAAGRPLTSNVSFGGNYLFSVAIPAGSIYSAITLRPQ